MFSYLCVLLFRVDMAILNLLPSVFIEALDSHSKRMATLKWALSLTCCPSTASL